MERRDFLRKSLLSLAGGLLVGDAALEAYDRLTHVRKHFPGAAIGDDTAYVESFTMRGRQLPRGTYRLNGPLRVAGNGTIVEGSIFDIQFRDIWVEFKQGTSHALVCNSVFRNALGDETTFTGTILHA